MQSDWSKRVQYLPYCTLSLNNVLFDKKIELPGRKKVENYS